MKVHVAMTDAGVVSVYSDREAAELAVSGKRSSVGTWPTGRVFYNLDVRDDRLALIGRDRSLMDKVTEHLREGAARFDQGVGGATEERRGSSFNIAVVDDGERTGHVARVTVELDRVEQVPR